MTGAAWQNRAMLRAPCSAVFSVAAVAFIAGACSSEAIPTAAELQGTWVGAADGTYRVFVFSAVDDGSHPELAGLADVYVLYRYPIGDPPTMVQSGHYEVDEVTLNENGAEVTDDALVTVIATDVSGLPPGSRFGNGLERWTGDRFTLRGVPTSTGDLTLDRAADGMPP